MIFIQRCFYFILARILNKQGIHIYSCTELPLFLLIVLIGFPTFLAIWCKSVFSLCYGNIHNELST